MKFVLGITTWAMLANTATAFAPTSSLATSTTPTALHMVLEKPKEKKLAKIEQLKVDSDHLLQPLKDVRSIYLSSVVFVVVSSISLRLATRGTIWLVQKQPTTNVVFLGRLTTIRNNQRHYHSK